MDTAIPKFVAMILVGMAGGLLSQLLMAEIQSGPTAGDAVPKLAVLQLQADDTYEANDAASSAQTKPTVYLFVNSAQWGRPMARFMVDLDRKLQEFSPQAEMAVVWLTNDVDQSKEYLPRAAKSLKLEHSSLAVFDGKASGPEGWTIDSEAHLTVVIAQEGKVKTSIGFISVNETDVPAIGEALRKPVESK